MSRPEPKPGVLVVQQGPMQGQALRLPAHEPVALPAAFGLGRMTLALAVDRSGRTVLLVPSGVPVLGRGAGAATDALVLEERGAVRVGKMPCQWFFGAPPASAASGATTSAPGDGTAELSTGDLELVADGSAAVARVSATPALAASALGLLAPEGAPATVGRYTLVRRLGAGSFGAVFEARGPRGEAVALKVLHQRDAKWQVYARFLRETDALRTLAHPHIVRLYEADEDPRVGAYYVMELVTGGRASELAPTEPVLPQALRVASELFAALAHLHAHDWVHRDVKPDNVLLTPPDARGLRHGKLCDFGLARGAEGYAPEMALTREGEFGGTPSMSAPEQWEQFGRFDPAMDVYSAAATTYRLCTGLVPLSLTEPLERVSLAKLHRAVFSLPRVPLRERAPWVPPRVAALLDALVAIEPTARRATSAAEVSAALDDAATALGA